MVLCSVAYVSSTSIYKGKESVREILFQHPYQLLHIRRGMHYHVFKVFLPSLFFSLFLALLVLILALDFVDFISLQFWEIGSADFLPIALAEIVSILVQTTIVEAWW